MGNESFPIHAPFIIGQSWGMIPWAIHAPFSFPIHWEFCSLPIHGESPWPIQGPVYCHGPFMGLGACAVAPPRPRLSTMLKKDAEPALGPTW